MKNIRDKKSKNKGKNFKRLDNNKSNIITSSYVITNSYIITIGLNREKKIGSHQSITNHVPPYRFEDRDLCQSLLQPPIKKLKRCKRYANL